MATYLQGVTDYIPQIQPWTPDYNLYAKVLDFKQSRQDAAVKQLSTLYGSLLNAPLTREDTAESREKFFKTIDQDIKKMASLDLSKRQNVEAARDVFNQILDNDLFVKDMVYTKNWMSEYQKGQSLKGCTDPEKCQGQWWEGGDQYMNFKRMEFKNASAEDAMNFGNVGYVAKQDITQKAIALAKELDIEIEAGPQFANGFIITGASNDLEERKLYNQIFTGIIGEDPLVREYYKAKAYNKRMGWAYENEEQYGSVDAANVEYINQSYNLIQGITNQKDAAEDKVATTQKKIDKLNKDAGDDIPARRPTYVSLYQDLVKERGAYDQTKTLLEETENTAKAAVNYAGTPKVSGEYMDQVLALGELQQDILGAAQQMAFKKVKAGDMKVNQYELEAQKQQYRKDFEAIQFKNKILLAQAKGELVNSDTLNGTPEENTPVAEDVAGSTQIGALDMDQYDYLTRTEQAFMKDVAGVRSDLSKHEASLFNQMLERAKAEGDLGDIQAKEDYVNMFLSYYNGLYEENEQFNLGGGLADGDIQPTEVSKQGNFAEYDKLVRGINNATTAEEKYQIAKKANIDLNKLSGSGIDFIYDNSLSKMMDPKDKKAKLRKNLYESILVKNPNVVQEIRYKNKVFKDFEDIYTKQVNQVIADSRTGAFKNSVPLFEALMNPTTGKVRSESDFVSALKANRGSVKDADLRDELNDLSDENIREIYNGTYEDIEDFINLSFDELGWTEDVQLRDIWKVAYTEYVKPEGNKALVPGAGDEYARGHKFTNVDPDHVNSNGMKGATTFMKDVVKTNDAVVDLNTFKNNIPDLAESTIQQNKAMVQQILTGITYYKGKDYRPYFDVTFTNVAGSNSNYAGMNIKVTNPAFFDKYKGVKDNRGPLFENREKIMSEGITMYLPKSEADPYNFFVQNSKRNNVHKLLDWQGSIDLDQYGYNPYVKDMKVVRNSDGTYSVDGAYRVGVTTEGKEEFDSYLGKTKYMPNANISEIMKDIHEHVMKVTEMNLAVDEKLKSNK
jgi:hypothetical protein